MLVVLSDLHLSEDKSTHIGIRKSYRNLSPDTYRTYLLELDQLAKANDIGHLDFVLAGDIFEITRSSVWLETEKRPYIDNDEISPGSDMEKIVLDILNNIACEERVAGTLQLFQEIQNNFDAYVKLHLILGNHDRLLNATPSIRTRVRELLGLEPSATIFPSHLIFDDWLGKPFCLVRHGHEYDPTNFALNIQKLNEIPTSIPLSAYGNACLGDIITIEYGASLPWIFEQIYGEEAIQEDETLLARA